MTVLPLPAAEAAAGLTVLLKQRHDKSAPNTTGDEEVFFDKRTI